MTLSITATKLLLISALLGLGGLASGLTIKGENEDQDKQEKHNPDTGMWGGNFSNFVLSKLKRFF